MDDMKNWSDEKLEEMRMRFQQLFNQTSDDPDEDNWYLIEGVREMEPEQERRKSA